MNWGKNSRARRRAGVVVQVAVASTALLGMAALVVDIGMVYTAKTELQVSADAAALAAAAELMTSSDPRPTALIAADFYAGKNRVFGMTPTVLPEDIEFGRAVPNAGAPDRFHFEPAVDRWDAVRVRLRHAKTSQPGQSAALWIPTTFAQVLGITDQVLEAEATAVLIPRDISVVIDLSGSMNDDSEVRHYKRYLGERGVWQDGVQVNLRDVWCALDGPAPSRPYVPPASEAGSEYSTDIGPALGALTSWGAALTPETYNPSADAGLWYIPKSSSCTVAEARPSLRSRGCSDDEVNCLLSSSQDSSYSNQWRTRTAVIVGLATWKSGRSGGRPGGNKDAIVQDGELTWAAYPSFRGNWTWADYISYVSQTGTVMYGANKSFRYRFGPKTFVNFLLESECGISQTTNLYATPQQPLQAVKDAVQVMTDEIIGYDNLDQMSLEIFASTARHEVDLTRNLQAVPDRLYNMQAGHYNTTTNMGAALQTAMAELNSIRARRNSGKIIMLMSDGKPNVDRYGNFDSDGSTAIDNWVKSLATQAADQGIRVYTISVGSDADVNLMVEIAAIGKGEHFHAEGTPAQYAAQLEEIFRTLGGKRPTALIE